MAELDDFPFIEGHTGAQLFVSRNGATLLDEARGFAAEQRPMTTDKMLPWLSCAKPVTAFAVLRCLEDGGSTIDTPVARVVPEFAQNGKQDVTFAHLLTHTVPYRGFGIRYAGPNAAKEDDTYFFDGRGWNEALELICREPLSAKAGTQAVYTSFASWHVLGEAVQRMAGQDYELFTTREVMGPLGTDNSVLFPSRRLVEERPDDLGYLHTVIGGRAVRLPSEEPGPLAAQRGVGVSARGPAADLAKVTQCLLADGWGARGRVISAEAAKSMSSVHRAGLADGCYNGLDARWGLGVTTDPLVFGLPARIRVVGHTGYRASFVFSDLDHGVTVAFIATGRAESDVDRERPRKWRITRQLYRDLGIGD